MRHLRVVNHLGRTSSHRKAMLANMASSLIMNKRITTTEAKAKALRTYVEPLITRSKEDSTHSRRVVFSYLRDKKAVAELFREVSPKVGERPGGYTRILKLGTRFGDNADMCIIELVDYNENMLAADDSKSKTSRRRRSTKKKSETVAVAAPVVAAPIQSKTADAEPVVDSTTDKAITTAEAVSDINEEGAEKADKQEEQGKED